MLGSMPVPVCKRARALLPQGARPGLLRLWRGQARAVLRLAAAPGLLADRRAGGLRPGAGRAARPAPLHALTHGLPAGATVYGDKGDNAAPDEATILADAAVRLVPIRKANMAPNLRADKLALRACRKRIETLYSQLAAMVLQQLHARTNPGLALKVHAALLAATSTNAD